MGKKKETINIYNPFSKKREDIPCTDQCGFCIKNDTSVRCAAYFPIPEEYRLGEAACPKFEEPVRD